MKQWEEFDKRAATNLIVGTYPRNTSVREHNNSQTMTLIEWLFPSALNILPNSTLLVKRLNVSGSSNMFRYVDNRLHGTVISMYIHSEGKHHPFPSALPQFYHSS